MARRYIRDARGRFAEVPGLDEQIAEMGVGGNANVLDDLLDRIQDDLKHNDPNGVTVKIPSGSEVTLSRKLAQFLTGDSDEAPPKQKAQRLQTDEEAVAAARREKVRARIREQEAKRERLKKTRDQNTTGAAATEPKPGERYSNPANWQPGDVIINGQGSKREVFRILSVDERTPEYTVVATESLSSGMKVRKRIPNGPSNHYSEPDDPRHKGKGLPDVDRSSPAEQEARDRRNREYFQSFGKKSDPFSEGNKDVYGNPAVNSQTPEQKAKMDAANERFRERLKKEEDDARSARNKAYFESFGKKQDLFSEGNKDVYGNAAVNSQTAEDKAKQDAANKRFAASLGGKNADGSDPGSTPGPTNQQKIDNAAKMYGVGSPQHKEAQQRFGPTAREKRIQENIARAKDAEATYGKGSPQHQKVMADNLDNALRGESGYVSPTSDRAEAKRERARARREQKRREETGLTFKESTAPRRPEDIAAENFARGIRQGEKALARERAASTGVEAALAEARRIAKRERARKRRAAAKG